MSRVNRSPVEIAGNRPGPSESLNAPGVTVIPGDSPGVRAANELMAALGGVGRTAVSLGALASGQAADARREIAELERDAAQHREVVRGEAALAAHNEAPGVLLDIAEGRIPIPDDVPAFVQQFADERTKDIPSAEYRQRYREVLAPAMAQELAKQRELHSASTREASFNTWAASAATATTAEAMTAPLEEARKLYGSRVSDEELIAKVILPGAKAAAVGGDTLRFDLAKGIIGDRFPDRTAALDVTFGEARARARAETGRQFSNDIARLLDDETPFKLIRERVESWRGKAEDDDIERTNREIDNREAAALRATTAEAIKLEVGQIHAKLDAAADSLVASGRGFSIEDFTYTDSAGHVHKFDRGEVLEAAMERAFERLNQTGKDAADSFDKQLALAALNGWVPKDWTRALAAGAMAANESNLAPDKPQPLPPATLVGFALFKALRAKAPGMLEAMTLDASARDLYETALTLQDDPQIGPDDSQALLGARRMLSGPGAGPLGAIQDQAVRDATADIVSRFWSADAINAPEVGAQIYNRARVYARTGLSPEKAVKRASDLVGKGRVTINGWSQPTANAMLPEPVQAALPQLADRIIADWLAGPGEDTGIEASDLTLRAGINNGFWVLAHGNSGLPVPPGPGVIFSTADLIKLAGDVETQKRAEADAGIIRRQNAGPPQPPTVDILPRKRKGESEPDYLRRIGRRRPGEF